MGSLSAMAISSCFGILFRPGSAAAMGSTSAAGLSSAMGRGPVRIPKPPCKQRIGPRGGSFAFAARAHGGSGRRLAPMAFVAAAWKEFRSHRGDKSWASRAHFSTYTDIRGRGACWHGGKGVLWLTPDQGKYDKEWTAAFGALVFPIGNVCISLKTCTRRPFSVTEPRLGGV